MAFSIIAFMCESARAEGGGGKLGWMKAYSFLLGKTQVEDVVPWGEIDMDNATVLEKFIRLGKAQYPAENYILLISGHGGGLQRGFGGDVDSYKQRTGSNYLYDPTGMSIAELSQGSALWVGNCD